MKLIIAGGRDMRVSYNFILSLLTYYEIKLDQITEIVQGEAAGIDYCGKMFALKANIPFKSFPYKSELGKAGGPVRNAEMAEYADALLLIWDGNSRGSNSMKSQARSRNLFIMENILRPTLQSKRKELGIYVEPKDRLSSINKSNNANTLMNPGAMV